MYPPLARSTLLNSSISDSWSDEELVLFLVERKEGNSLPENVVVDMDVSLVDPPISSPGKHMVPELVR